MNQENIYTDPCHKLDPWCVDAYLNLSLDPIDPAQLILDDSWGQSIVDLTPAVKTAETITHLLITDTALQYNREDYGREGAEDNGIDCWSGTQLGRIIPMQSLKDVAQEPAIATGDVYMYDSFVGLFQPFALQKFVDSTNATLKNLQDRITTVEQKLLLS